MSILRALNGYYERQASRGKASAYGFSKQGISFAVVLDSDGGARDVMDVRDTTGRKPRPGVREVPRPEVRSVNVRPNFLWDSTTYVFGVRRDARRGGVVPAKRGEHDAFVSLHRELLADTEDEGLRALLAFLEDWSTDRYEALPHSEEMLGENVAFCLEPARGLPTFLHESEAGRRIWTRWLDGEDTDQGFCLVTGKRLPAARLHPKIKGVTGAQTSGASIVSFNNDAFTSFGKKQGANAPVSKRAAFAYTSALNALLARNSRNRMRIGDTTTVFWAEADGDSESAEAAEDLFSMLVAPPTDEEESVAVHDTVKAIADGRPLEVVEPRIRDPRHTRFFVLGLAPNAARLSVRFWLEDSIGRIGERLGEHWKDLRIEPEPWRTPPAIWRLLRETAVQGKSENVPSVLGGALMDAILRGGRYPRSLLTGVLMRMRSDGNTKDYQVGLRAAICKACLARDARLGHQKESIPVSLNQDEKNPAYRLGRLFALYEGVQRAALGKVNATIKDKFYGSASATPASVFPMLARTSTHHLATIRKNKGGLAVRYERQLDEVFDGFETEFPRSLGIEDQGRFTIGYYHQRAKLYEGKSASDSALAQED
ncbi:MAG: type I-C CRISPR-associated protein Cas8c/Csd1 [Gammaproteobacteria bacterium]|nr:type I-C CRISPR-associated protein Cas8c/Csd1 [Gammaproteobacteria bacterium]